MLRNSRLGSGASLEAVTTCGKFGVEQVSSRRANVWNPDPAPAPVEWDAEPRSGVPAPKAAPESTSGDPNFMLSLARGLMVIRAFTQRSPKLSIAEVARISGLPRAVARRCLYTLMQLGYVGTDGRTFFLRPKILSLGYAYLSSTPLAISVQPYLECVSQSLHESCSVGVLEDDEVVYIARAAARRIMSVDLNVGSRLPAYCSSLGRVLLAHLPPAELEAYLGRIELKPFTEHTITRRDALLEALEQVRQTGYALVDQELEIGLRSLAVPIRNVAGQVVAAMNVSGQAARVSRQEMEGRFLPVLQAAAQELRVLLVT
jgi:IclR family pca regulon transcriptional regulator